MEDGVNDQDLARLGSMLVALLQRCHVAEEEGFLVEVMEIEAALTSLRAELALVVERRRGGYSG